MKKLLLSARDPGAAGNIAVLYEDLLKTGCFDISLAASGAAWSILKKKGFRPEFFGISGNRDHIDTSASNENPENKKAVLLEKTSEILKRTAPDAVITGLSSFGAGIDEAIALLADVPVFAVQDFWGDVNLSLGKTADVYLVMDEFAAEITEKRCGAETRIIGSPKYSRYASADPAKMRKTARQCLDVSDEIKIIGWFGQHPDIPGYRGVFDIFLNSVRMLDLHFDADFMVMFREHPKFGVTGVKNADFLCSNGIKSNDVTGKGSAEEWIAACDLLVTPFSLCGVDHAYISAFSENPSGNVLYLMSNHEIRDFFTETTGIDKIPLVEKGIGKWSVDSGIHSISSCMEKMLGFDETLAYHKASRNLMDSYSINKIKNILLETLS